MCNSLFGGNNWIIILILILLFCGDGNTFSNGCGCNSCGCTRDSGCNSCGCGC